jgi:predicted acetyltransferase
LVALARDAATGQAVGSGLVDGPLDGIGELAAVGVIEQYRRRGIAGAMSLHLAMKAHEQGMKLVWLEAAPEEEGIYKRAGFTPSGAKLWISRR